MRKIIITGTLGSGKSLFRELLQEELNKDGEDFIFMDMDTIINDAYEDERIKDALYYALGTCDKTKVSKMVFENDEARNSVNEIMRVVAESSLLGIANSPLNVVIEVPLFFEMAAQPKSIMNSIRQHFTVISVTMNNAEVRKERVRARCKIKHPEWTDETIDKVISVQFPDFLKRALADVIFYNDGTVEDLKAKIEDYVIRGINYVSYESDVSFTEELFGARFTNIADDIFRIVEFQYSAKSRAYHTVEHIRNMCHDLRYAWTQDNIETNVLSNTALQLAILFHDFVYDPRSSVNEQESVKMMYSLVDMFNPNVAPNLPEVLELASFMILSTVKHELPSGEEADKMYAKYPELLNLTKIFLDLDLGVFMHYYSFRDFEKNIRAEYGMVPSSIYYPKRLEILGEFAKRDQIYLSDIFGNNSNLIAKRNLNTLIEYVKYRMEDNEEEK
jgi:dephospho-CoA kinase/predicted metal-dependent HD superfamily phosphohydrolase